MAPPKEHTTYADETAEGARSFNVLFARLDDGAIHSDASDQLHELLVKLAAHAALYGKSKATMSLTLAFAMEHGGTVDIRVETKTKTPIASRNKTTLWLTPGHNLTPKNPKQLEFGAVREAPKPETKEATSK